MIRSAQAIKDIFKHENLDSVNKYLTFKIFLCLNLDFSLNQGKNFGSLKRIIVGDVEYQFFVNKSKIVVCVPCVFFLFFILF